MGGLKAWLPYGVSKATNSTFGEGDDLDGAGGEDNTIFGVYPVADTAIGAINFTNVTDRGAGGSAGHSWDTYYLSMVGEDKDDNLATGRYFAVQLDQNSDGDIETDQVNVSVGAFAGSGGPTGKEQATTSIYEAYVIDDVAPKILHYTKPDRDYAEVYYPTGVSESYAKVFLTSTSATSVPEGGAVLVKDTEVSSVATKNLIIVGGSCINSAAATLVGGAFCGEAWTTATNAGSGQFVVKAYPDSTLTSALAMLVAGYEAADTQASSTYVRTQTFDTSTVDYTGPVVSV